MTFTRRALVAMAVAAASTVVLPTVVGALLLVAVVAVSAADAWVVRAVPGTTRTLPPHLSRGVPSTVTVSAATPSTRIRQAVASPDLRLEPREGEGDLVATIVARRRGTHRLAPIATLRRGPLGLGAWLHRSGDEAEIVVYPDMPAAARIAMQVRTGLFREDGRRSRGPLGLGTELEAIREYQPDDDIRQVNWRATARTGTPMSNTYRVEQDRDVICLLDCGRLMASPVTTASGTVLTRLDAAVDAVAAMAAVADEVGDRIGVVAFADHPLTVVAPRRSGGALVVDAVHDLEPMRVDSDFERAAAAVAGRKRAFVLVLTDLLDPSAARALLASLPTLTRSHQVAVATVADPVIVEALTTPSEDDRGLTRTAVAASVSNRRAEVAAEIAHRGAEVIDADAAGLSARCVGSYLRAKSRARL